MKITYLVVIGILAILLGGAAWFLDHHAAHSNLARPTIPPPPRAPSLTTHLVAGQWREYHEVREKTLANNPALAAKFQELQKQIAQQESDLNVAMIKADPKVAPIIAKFEAFRAQSRNSPSLVQAKSSLSQP